MLLPGFRPRERMPALMRRAALLIGVLLVVMAPALLVRPLRSVQVHTDTGAFVWCARVDADDVMQLQFTHSMFGGYVREQWRITPDSQFERVRFVTEHAASAEYYATDGSSYRAEDGYVVPGESLMRTSLVVRVNTRGDHVLSVGKNTARLADLLPQSTQVHISVAPTDCDNPS